MIISSTRLKPVRRLLSIRANSSLLVPWLPAGFRLLAVVLGGLHTLAAVARHSMNPDGIAYLDMADAYLRGDWQAAINPVWSPLYSWVLGPVMRAVQPPMRWEFAVVQLVNFAIYLGALACFEFYWRQVRRYAETRAPTEVAEGAMTQPGWAWPLLGYALFIWTALSLIEIWSVTPDMLMAALVYLAAGLVLRIRQGEAARITFGMLGVVLGLAYLAKAVMFPLSLVLLGISLLSVPRPRHAAWLALAGLAGFATFSLTFVAAISQAKGRLTVGEVGRLTFVWYINGVAYPHWQGDPPESGVPLHPSRKIFEEPPIYEFATPIAGTYPISYDPSYWYEGVVPRFDWLDQARASVSAARFYFDLFFRQQGILILGVSILYCLSSWPRLTLHRLIHRWGLAIFALSVFGLYAMVYLEGRFVGVFVTLLWGDLLANVRLPDEPVRRRVAAWVSGAMLASVLIGILAFNLEGLTALVDSGAAAPGEDQSAPAPSWPGEAAEALHQEGIRPGDRVAVIGYAFDSYWARLARVQIVAEMLEWQAGPFWLGDATVRSRVIEAFTRTGAKAIVAEHVPAYASLDGWHQIGDTNYHVYLLTEAAPIQMP